MIQEEVPVNLRRSVLRTAGTTAVVAAAHQMATGVRGVRGADAPRKGVVGDRSVDSELRFYAAWYGVAGAAMVVAARDREADRLLGPLLASGWAASSVARLLSVRAVGRPDPLFSALAGLEAALAGLLFATRIGQPQDPHSLATPDVPSACRPDGVSVRMWLTR